MEPLLDATRMAGMAVISVSLWTLRVALTARGRMVAGAVIAGAEALVFLLAFSSVLADMDAVEKVAGYAIGVAAGTLIGVFLDDKLSAGQSLVRVVTPGSDLGLVNYLHDLGWPVTHLEGTGPEGAVTVALIAVDDKQLQRLTAELEQCAVGSFWTVERLKKARATRQHNDWIQVHGRRTARTSA